MAKTFDFTDRFGAHAVQLVRSFYLVDDTFAVMMREVCEDGVVPYAHVTKNLDASCLLPKNSAFIDNDLLPNLADWLVENALAEPLSVMVDGYPAVRFTDAFFSSSFLPTGA